MPFTMHYSDVHPELKVFKVRFSSSHHSTYLDFRFNKENLDKYTAMFRLINSNFRSYDSVTKVWIFSQTFRDIILRLPDVHGHVTKLHSWDKFDKFFSLNQPLDDFNSTQAPSPEDFFHAASPQSSVIVRTLPLIKADFLALTGFELNGKSDYRRAALMFHPDRVSQQEAAKMYTVNQLWKEFQSLT